MEMEMEGRGAEMEMEMEDGFHNEQRTYPMPFHCKCSV